MSRRRNGSRTHELSRRGGSAPRTSSKVTAETPFTRRIPVIDALRGVAVCLMIIYHFCFDLSWFGLIRANFNGDPFWLAARAIIVTSFLLLVGVSLVLADRSHQSPRQFSRRLLLVAVCAMIVTATSFVMFPARFIFFGILHCVVVASLVAIPVVRKPIFALIAGIAVLLVGLTVQWSVFDSPWLNWIGLMTHKPATEDYVPLFPWLAMVLFGIAIAHALFKTDVIVTKVASVATPGWLNWAGRHSLVIYMLHQPILIGVLRLWRG